MAVDPRLLRAIQTRAPRGLQPLLLATALVESGGRLGAVGDQGQSIGPYQEHSAGRGAGLSAAQRQDPAASTMRALREFQTFAARGARGAELAYRAQRPADRTGYIRKINAALPQARQLLAQAGAGAPAQQTGAQQTGAQQIPDIQGLAGQLDARRLMMLLRNQAGRSLRGMMPAPGYLPELTKLAQQAFPRAEMLAAIQGVGAQAAGAGQAVGRAVAPLQTAMPTRSEYNIADPEGAPGPRGRVHAGLDWFAPAGSAVRAPVSGKVVEVKPSRGRSGQVFGGTVKIQGPDGKVYVFRHVDPKGVRVGQQVRAGTPVAGVTGWTEGSDHAHIEVWKTLGGGYRAENMLDPLTVFGGGRR